MTAAEILAAAGLAEAERRGQFTDRESDLSLGWTTCACGKSDPRIPRGSFGEPLDDRLWDLGDDFARRVVGNHFAEAARSLVAIERRVAELLAEAAP